MTVWAAIGVVWLVVVAQAMFRWATSDTEFAPAPVLDPDAIPAWNLLALRIFEGLCVVVIAALVWFCVIRSWRRTGALGLDGKFVIAGLLALVADTFLNAYAYLFAWNANNINRGSWAAFMPLHNPASPTRFAEDLLWAPGMYMYFCAGHRDPRVSAVLLAALAAAAVEPGVGAGDGLRCRVRIRLRHGEHRHPADARVLLRADLRAAHTVGRQPVSVSDLRVFFWSPR